MYVHVDRISKQILEKLHVYTKCIQIVQHASKKRNFLNIICIFRFNESRTILTNEITIKCSLKSLYYK